MIVQPRPWLDEHRRCALAMLAMFTGCIPSAPVERTEGNQVETIEQPEVTPRPVAPVAPVAPLVEGGRHFLAWTLTPPLDRNRGTKVETAWLRETPEKSWRKLATRGEPVLASPDGNLWAIRHDCWDSTGNHRDDCRQMQLLKQHGHGAEGTAQIDLLNGRSRPMKVTSREERPPPEAKLPLDRVLGLRVDDVVRPYRRNKLTTLGHYVLWGQEFRFQTITDPAPVLHMQDIRDGSWVTLLDPGEWSQMLSESPEERLLRFRSHSELGRWNGRLLEEEQTRFNRLLVRFGDDGRMVAKAEYLATFCCRRSCSIGPLEPFWLETLFDLEQVPHKLTAWAALPHSVREHFASFQVEERRGWSEIPVQGEQLQRIYEAFTKQ